MRSTRRSAASIEEPPRTDILRPYRQNGAVRPRMEQSAPDLYDRFIVLSYIASCRTYFGAKATSLLTCDPGIQNEFPRPRPTFSQMLCNGALSGKRHAVFGRGLSRTAPGERLDSLCSFIPGSTTETAAATGDYTSSDAYEIVFPAKSIVRANADLSFHPKIGRYQTKSAGSCLVVIISQKKRKVY